MRIDNEGMGNGKSPEFATGAETGITMKARAWALVGTGMSFLLVGTSLAAAPVPREGPISGRIVAKKQGETAVLVPTRQQRPAEVRQDLKAGDVLRTNAAGTLAIVFADRTQIRLGRNSTLVVKQVRQGSPSSVTLQRGSLWSRSPRGASNLSVETPSATAAIRGTEYSIVADEEQTTLSVIDGVVDFFNPQGSLEVREGQSASARLGQAPTRIFTVNPATREQMLYYMALEEGLAYLRPSPVSQIASRSIVERVKAIAPDNRTPEDWILLAEAGAEIEAKASIVSALARARSAGLTPGQEARAKLVEAGYAAKARDFRRALRLYEEALPSLSGRQREVARYGRFIARTLVDPAIADEELPPLNEGEAVSYVGQAYIAAYLGEFDKARAIVDVGLRRFPNESALYAIKGGIGILTGDEKAMDEASQRALAIDPADPFAISIRAVLDLHYRGNPEAAVRSAEVAVRSAPGKDEFWSLLGEALHTREETRKAESAFLAGLAEEPHSFIMRGNYSLFLLQLDRTEESREQLRIARGLDPDNALVHLIEGFLDLKEGRRDLALEHALDASAANPSYSEALLLLAEIHYANGDYELARQQLDAADKADPKNPFVALYRAAFAIDHYEADAAILAAREAVRRYRARGGVYASLSESKGTGSYIAGAFRFLNLGEWARYHGDRNHDPFVPVALFDRALSQVPDPFLVKQEFFPFDAQAGGDSSAVSDVFQGLRLDPLSISAPEKDLHITRQKFFELSLTPSLLVADERVTSSQSATINGLLLRPTPLAFSVVATHDRVELPVGRNNDREGNSVLGFFGLEPSPHDHLIIFTGYSDQRKELTGTLDAPRDNGEVNDRSALLFALYAHQFGREHIVSLGGGLSEARRDLKRRDDVLVGDLPFLFDLQYRDQQKAETKFAFLDHAIGLGAVDLQAGAEYMTTDMKQSVSRTVALSGLGSESDFNEITAKAKQYRAYVDAHFTPSNSLTIQGQVALTGTGIDGADDQNFDFSFGVAVEPIEGHWLRAAYVRNTSTDLPFTLAPTAVVGLRQNDAPVLDGSQSESVIGRWDAEWDEHLFTSVEVQHQDFDGLSFDRPNIVTPIINFLFDPLPGARPVAVGPSELTRVSVSANLWLTGNIGVRAVYSFSSTDVMSGPGAGGPIPFISRHFARGQVTWTHPSRIRVSGGLSWTPRKTLAFDGVV
jgi:tetratricopeptide (TPR) repeat protein